MGFGKFGFVQQLFELFSNFCQHNYKHNIAAAIKEFRIEENFIKRIEHIEKGPDCAQSVLPKVY